MTTTDINGKDRVRRIASPSVQHFIDYESGSMPDEEVIAFFQMLIDNGMAWTLQGHYGRTAMHLIETKRCKPVKTLGETDDRQED